MGNSVRGIKAGKIITKGIYNIKDKEQKFCPPPPKHPRLKKRTSKTKRKKRTNKTKRTRKAKN
jgi:hypothetical protein